MQEIFVYGDESGVFYKPKNNIFTFGGILCLSESELEKQLSRYRTAEKHVRERLGESAPDELKACLLANEHRNLLFKAINVATPFGAIIHQKKLKDEIFIHKKTRQRYLDYAFRVALKRPLERMIATGKLLPDKPSRIHVRFDEHTTATNGRYELSEGIEEEFARGIWSADYQRHWPPILPGLKSVKVDYLDSQNEELIRASDIVANRLRWIGMTYQRYADTGIIIRKFP